MPSALPRSSAFARPSRMGSPSRCPLGSLVVLEVGDAGEAGGGDELPAAVHHPRGRLRALHLRTEPPHPRLPRAPPPGNHPPACQSMTGDDVGLAESGGSGGGPPPRGRRPCRQGSREGGRGDPVGEGERVGRMKVGDWLQVHPGLRVASPPTPAALPGRPLRPGQARLEPGSKCLIEWSEPNLFSIVDRSLSDQNHASSGARRKPSNNIPLKDATTKATQVLGRT